MLIQSTHLSSIEDALFYVSDHGKQDFVCDWMPGSETWQMCPKCDGNSHGGCREAVSITEEKKKADPSRPVNFPRSCSQLSSVSTMSESSAPNLVYKRRRLRLNSVALFSMQDPANAKKSGDCPSVVSSDPSVVPKEQHVVSQVEFETEAVEAPVLSPHVCNRDSHVSNSESINGCSVGEERGFDEASRNSMHKVLEVDSINDSCSSSKSNMELVSVSVKTEVDDAGECSSSSVIVSEIMGEDLSEKDLCIFILRSQGLLPIRTRASAEGNGTTISSSCSRPCKICGHSETAVNMLICDNCEEAFHVSCWNSRTKKVPIDEWFCHSCLKKKHKILKETTTRRSSNISGELGRCRNASSKSESNPIAFMLRDTEPYTTGVRIGKGFQAEVPDWSGPINNDVDTIGEPLEMDPFECIGLRELNSNTPSKLRSIGNWLQCREVIDGVGEGANGTICGKWRRAPLFEVQTDEWECFCSVLWDPAHADCAVPQELETDQVLKQLKYIEMLRPRLAAAAKRHKLDETKHGGSEEPIEDVTNILTQAL